MLENSFYYATVLSNFSRAYDKYSREYRKRLIVQSTYPDEFYLLKREEISFGLDKARKLSAKLSTPEDRVLVLRTELPQERVHKNTRSGVGWVLPSADLPVHSLYLPDSAGTLGEAVPVEEIMAKSLKLNSARFQPYTELTPRSVSFLPISRGCQAACPFCFSEASVSRDQAQGRLSAEYIKTVAAIARDRGAVRAVITGGGEPMLLPSARLLELVGNLSGVFDKVVLISNGVALSRAAPAALVRQLLDLRRAGLTVLAISRHHFDEKQNALLMNLETGTETLLQCLVSLKSALLSLTPRLICVLQKGGIECTEDIGHYLDWAVRNGVEEVCFKELYVSTSLESVYHLEASNAFSRARHVPLSIVSEWARTCGFQERSRLPWGAPVFSGILHGRPLQVAAYSEPSLFWERATGLARSWNVMADGRCLVSLEDRASEIKLPVADPCAALQAPIA
jgi:uncharacterized Fe-S cluster-containing radical SAM superfamily protein